MEREEEEKRDGGREGETERVQKRKKVREGRRKRGEEPPGGVKGKRHWTSIQYAKFMVHLCCCTQVYRLGSGG